MPNGIAHAALAAVMAVSVVALAADGRAQTASGKEQSGQPPADQHMPRGFDYWQPDWMVRELWGPGRMPKSMMARLLRHTTYMQFGVPNEYEGAQTTVKADAATIAAGRNVYARDCASCHGKRGLGGGESASSLSPSPALLSYMIRRPVSVDEYLLWSIADGGKQFNTTMPAFKDKLSRDEIWQVIAFMRAGFPAEGEKPKPGEAQAPKGK